MTTTTISLQVPQSRTAPRYAALFGELFASAIALLTPRGTQAPRYPSREAARVRAMAHRYEGADPRFASELYAAADRHEMLYGD
ncbi:MAG TPA: hypothetical protein VFL64_12085 [Rhizobacter sp.]|nr:hypothetical protein [Rhizobacter sp.]